MIRVDVAHQATLQRVDVGCCHGRSFVYTSMGRPNGIAGNRAARLLRGAFRGARADRRGVRPPRGSSAVTMRVLNPGYSVAVGKHGHHVPRAACGSYNRFAPLSNRIR